MELVMTPPREADRLRYWMKKRGLNRRQIAAATGRTVQAVHYWLTDRNDPPQECIAQICSAMGIDLPTFYGELDGWRPPDEGDGNDSSDDDGGEGKSAAAG